MGLKLKKSHNYTVMGQSVLFVDSSEKIERVQRMLADSTRVGLDTEFSGIKSLKKEHPFKRAAMVSMQFSCFGPKLKDVHQSKFIFVPNWDKYTGTFRHFKKFLEDDRETKVLHNYKIDAHVLENHGVRTHGLRADTLIKAALWNAAEEHKLKELARNYLNLDSPDFLDTFRIPKRKKNGELGKVSYTPSLNEVVAGALDDRWEGGGIKRLVEYAVKDPYYTVKLDQVLDKKLGDMEWTSKLSMLDYYNQLDNTFIQALYRMERRGCLLNQEYLEETQKRLVMETNALEQKIYKQLAKKGVPTRVLEELNINSNPQMSKLLTDMGLDLPRTEPSGRFPEGQPSVSDKSLQEIRHPKWREFINTLTEWRSLHDKLLKTYIKPWLAFVQDARSDSMLRSQFKYPGPITGRIASATPNLQNIPRPQEEGIGAGDRFLIRKAFVAPKEFLFGDADLSQIELRLMAHFSRDPEMLKAFNNGWDLHARTAIFCFSEVKEFVQGRTIDGKLLAEVKERFKTLRQHAKTVGFMIAYGGGPQRYADITGQSMQEGKRVIGELFRGYPYLKMSIDKIRASCHRHGYIRTILGRYIHIPDINHRDQGYRAEAERKAYNYVIQGSAAELMKLTMNLVDQCPRLEEMEVTMRLQIHDELCFYIPKGREKAAKRIIDDYMSNPYKHYGMKPLSVPTPGELGVGANWLEAKSA
jgi:DNA polymerase I